MKGWVAAGGGLVLVGLGVFLAAQGFDRAVGWAGVLSLFVGVAALVAAVLPLLGPRQSVEGTAGRDINQVGRVKNFSTGKGAPRKGATAGRDINRVEEAGDFRTGDDR
ncbi:hypothetical protein Afil01_59920 [Actinorhabdospora filicis]|uniref:Uncharacterized protein n=1 Tax=Actinorhabdospora filicis TaxID=1785913 RepID=A0A9W6WDU0_9ACTN|nr:hypothetical protein [Actinorhabdospora filicis]GLZ81185.1 hypothetical protein Afil01_59920 [Actinorhabdospora filicis]